MRLAPTRRFNSKPTTCHGLVVPVPDSTALQRSSCHPQLHPGISLACWRLLFSRKLCIGCPGFLGGLLSQEALHRMSVVSWRLLFSRKLCLGCPWLLGGLLFSRKLCIGCPGFLGGLLFSRKLCIGCPCFLEGFSSAGSCALDVRGFLEGFSSAGNFASDALGSWRGFLFSRKLCIGCPGFLGGLLFSRKLCIGCPWFLEGFSSEASFVPEAALGSSRGGSFISVLGFALGRLKLPLGDLVHGRLSRLLPPCDLVLFPGLHDRDPFLGPRLQHDHYRPLLQITLVPSPQDLLQQRERERGIGEREREREREIYIYI